MQGRLLKVLFSLFGWTRVTLAYVGIDALKIYDFNVVYWRLIKCDEDRAC